MAVLALQSALLVAPTQASDLAAPSAVAAVEPPLYTNKRPGAVHMMRASSGDYYAYDFADVNGAIKIKVWQSTDSVRWSAPTIINANTKANGRGWGLMKFWAPEVIESGGKFYMFYAAVFTGTTSHRLGLAIADSPLGPFNDIGAPLFRGTTIADWDVIDPNPFIDPFTNFKYLYFARDGGTVAAHPDGSGRTTRQSRIFGVRLDTNWRTPLTSFQLLLKPSQSWEYANHQSPDGTWRLWNEAPTMIKENNRFHLLYSANFWDSNDYAFGYATSDTPLGTFAKYGQNPLAEAIGAYHKAGHTSAVRSPDGSDWHVSYSVMFDDDGDGVDTIGRFVSRLGWRADDSLFVNGPHAGWQVMPSGSANWTDVGQTATLSASSTTTGQPVGRIVDDETGIYARLSKWEWRAANQRAGAWVRMNWATPQTATHLLVYDSAEPSRRVATGHFIVNGVDRYDVTLPQAAPLGSAPGLVEFPTPQSITSLQFVVDSMVQTGAAPAALTEIEVLSPTT
ncbi:MAG: family 43 glycosylhydrolase [Micromonosporaceae bacterium]